CVRDGYGAGLDYW
nr:immunoglobulin heavy chain junction region [Macaca mulatta]MOY18276.1 immunoglobulin heavy chain junction region [Macaca mulatta]MOY18312.1 immunoglobulin heavy chain junction region [Macaca mulatta]MOY19219.1 immunoglobulin heavy chain junction region [Macaca mulatta]MOY19495.1 immunoglobulin heavy chain junction region [Macaca mulatta]